MLEEMVMAKVDATQAAMLSGMAGNSYTVGQVTTTGNGLGTWLFLSPDGGAAGQGVMAVKLEGTRQMAQMSGLVGKSVTVGKAPTVVGGMGKWIVFYPKAALAAKGAAAAGAAGVGATALADSQLIMLKLEGARFAAQTPYLAGKTFTVVKTTTAAGGTGKWLFLQQAGGASKDIVALKVQNGATQMPWLVGKTFTIGKAPIIAGANASKYLVLQPATGLAAKGVAGAAATGMTAAAKGTCPTMKTIAFQTAGTGTTGAATGATAMTAGKTAVASTVAKSAAAGTIWSGTGMSLGLGLGLGAAGPALLGAIIVATGYSVYRYRKNRASEVVDSDDGLMEAIS